MDNRFSNVCLFIRLDLCDGIKLIFVDEPRPVFDRLLCGPESCKTELYSFLTGVSITL